MRSHSLIAPLLALAFCTGLRAEQPQLEKGAARFRVIGDQKNVPERYRLENHTFDWETQLKQAAGTNGVTVHHVRFPSPVETETKENNTVHAEFYRPKGDGPFPATIVLDVTAGDQQLSRIIAMHLASKGVAALFVQMAYYGPRRPAGSDLRLLSPNVPRTLDAVRQTVLDMRRASAWLEERKEVDPKRLGILGTSLGSFMGALTAEMEPRLGRVVVLLGGGGLVDAYWDDPRGESLRKLYSALGGNKERLKEIIAPVDPLTCAENLKDRKVLILAAKRDDIVPPRCAEALWEATGKQKIVWFDATHYSAALYIIPALNQMVQHLQN
jgi:dienelactone hydrolase